MIHTLDHKNNVSMAFPMSENIGIYTLIIIIPAILPKIQGFYFSYFAGKRCTRYHKNHQFLKKRPRVPAWHPSDSDSKWSHIKSIKTHFGTFTAWLPETSTRLLYK